MKFYRISLASAALSTVVSASPIASQSRFTVTQVPNPVSVVKSGPAALARALAKFGATPPANVMAAAAGNGSEPAIPNSNDTQYLCPVIIGGQTLSLDFDTGSADLWVFSTNLPAATQKGHNDFSPNQSLTFQSLRGSTWSISYGDGSSASGTVGTDEVNVGGTIVPNQAVELASRLSPSFASSAGDGLLGLAFSKINTVKPTGQQTFFDNASPNLAAPLFTCDLRPQKPGSYDFGFIDNSKYVGNIESTPVDPSRGFWEFTSPGYQVGNNAFVSQPIDAIADTGTTLFLTEDAIVSAYYSAVPDASLDTTQGGYVFPCASTLPDFTFRVNSNYDAVIPGSLINYASTDVSGTICFGGIQSNNGIGLSIFGDIMYKSQFVVHKGGSQPSLGFAAKPASSL